METASNVIKTSSNGIQYTDVVSAVVRADNHTDDTRTYSIAATINLNGNVVVSVSNGVVATRAELRQVASFIRKRDGALNVDFLDADENNAAILSAIAEFCLNLKVDAVSVE